MSKFRTLRKFTELEGFAEGVLCVFKINRSFAGLRDLVVVSVSMI